jgi:hypothetical protein
METRIDAVALHARDTASDSSVSRYAAGPQDASFSSIRNDVAYMQDWLLSTVAVSDPMSRSGAVKLSVPSHKKGPVVEPDEVGVAVSEAVVVAVCVMLGVSDNVCI